MTDWVIATIAISACVALVAGAWATAWQESRIAEVRAKYRGSRVDEQPKGEAESNPA